ncbi:hypothetical protein [Streptomyces massasporeus]|uniref:hypothetical protein n=1 Tax=Streptomyces massasporeus TaxID=67324 RepID=UPI00340A2371
MAKRKYDNATLAGLMTLCRGYCYWPGCTSRVITMVNGVPKLNAEIAHIRAINPGGKRFDPKWSEPERIYAVVTRKHSHTAVRGGSVVTKDRLHE